MNFPKNFLHTKSKPSRFISLSNKIEIMTEASSNTSVQTNGSTGSSLPKPDFSPFSKKNEIMSFKQYGSYKKQKNFFPQSPLKPTSQKFFTPINKIEGKNLFGSNKNEDVFRKLDFFESKKENKNTSEESSENSFRLFPIKSENFLFCKKISSGEFGEIYKCEEKTTKKIFAIKKIKNGSISSEYVKGKRIISKLKNKTIFSSFVADIINIWKETDENKENFIFVQMPFYNKGDVIDYLSNLERKKFTFTADFYWNLIFEMLCGVYCLHLNGLLHLDIKPTNFLVNDNNRVLIGDFGLAEEKENLSKATDLEGDIRYLSIEIFNGENHQKINEKSDIFSLGMSILEVLTKITLPKNGEMWHFFRKNDFNFDKLEEKVDLDWNIKASDEFKVLINKMVCPYENRKTILELLQDSKELKELNRRYLLLCSGEYQGNVNYDLEYSEFPKKEKSKLSTNNDFNNNNSNITPRKKVKINYD